MLSHITLGTNDFERSIGFYDKVLGTIGMKRMLHEPEHGFAAYGDPGGQPYLFICTPFNEEPATHGNGTHVAFMTPERAMVDKFHAAALALGGQDEGAPSLRPHYHEHYYGAYVRDLDGNKLQACCHAPGD